MGSGFAIYFIIWWVTLFAVLPFGVKSQLEAGEVSPGSDPGAPAVMRFFRVMAINSVIAGLVFVGVYYFVLPQLP
ncbi:MAG: DUF1467 family protein [Proteobacteria bacterium]|nr:DUF1467 family protein [Pseudomonadota bacterium]